MDQINLNNQNKEPKVLNKYGLYKPNVRRYQIPGLRSNPQLDNQTQHQWVVMQNKEGEFYFIDTFHISHGIGYNEKALETLIKFGDENTDNTYLINCAKHNCYYGGAVLVTEDSIKYFDEVIDLREYKFLGRTRGRTDISEYDNRDTISGVMLYREHGYPGGYDMVYKGARKNKNKQVDVLVSDIINNVRASCFFESDINKLVSYLDEPISEESKENIYNLITHLSVMSEADKIIRQARADYEKASRAIYEKYHPSQTNDN